MPQSTHCYHCRLVSGLIGMEGTAGLTNKAINEIGESRGIPKDFSLPKDHSFPATGSWTREVRSGSCRGELGPNAAPFCDSCCFVEGSGRNIFWWVARNNYRVVDVLHWCDGSPAS